MVKVKYESLFIDFQLKTLKIHFFICPNPSLIFGAGAICCGTIAGASAFPPSLPPFSPVLFSFPVFSPAFSFEPSPPAPSSAVPSSVAPSSVALEKLGLQGFVILPLSSYSLEPPALYNLKCVIVLILPPVSLIS